MTDQADVLEPVPTVGPFLRDKLLKLDKRVSDVAERLISCPSDDEAVHDLRVALRRLRTLLEVGRPVLGRYFVDEVRRSFRDVQRATGALRDEEVVLKIAHGLSVTHPDMVRWLLARRRREQRLRRGLVRHVTAGEIATGHRMLSALLAFRIKPSRDAPLAKFGRRAVESSLRGVQRRRDARPDDPDALHQLRIAYKRLRYTVETFAEVLPPELGVLAQPAANFQGRLGDIHDVDMVTVCARRARSLSHAARHEVLEGLAQARQRLMRSYAEELALSALAPTIPPQ
jgi:CHAD domain-containing protein